MKRWSLVLLAGAQLSCVSAAEFNNLKQRYDEAQVKLAQGQERLGSLGASVNEAQANVKQLQNDKAQARAELKLLEAERKQLDEEQQRLHVQLARLMEDRAELTSSKARLTQALVEVTQRKVEADRRVAEYRTLLARFQSLIDAGALRLVMSDGRMVLQLPSDVLFDSGSARLSTSGSATVEQITAVLREVPARRYQVEGHTDNVPIHNAQYRSNWELASARALGVVRAMVAGGVAASCVSAASFGEFHPAASNDHEEGRRDNRRIEIIVVPDLSLLPGYDELQRAVTAGS
ncbi:MAG: OmpA family protein [Polyangiales bacterium]